jgi:site-specific recombinase XerD
MTTEIAIKQNTDIQIQDAWDALSIETRAAYKSDLDQFMRFCNKAVEEVNAGDVAGYLKHMIDKGYKNSTINRKIASVSKMFTVYVQAGKINTNPVAMLRSIKKINYKTQRNVKSPVEYKALKKALEKPDTDKDKRIVLIVRFLALTGCRISEALKAKRSNISEHSKKSNKIMVMGKGSKERYVFISKKFQKEIFKAFPCKNDLLFCSEKGKLINRSYFWKIMVEFFKRKTGLHVHPHMMRHFFATYKIKEQGADVKSVSKFLGHSSTSITMDMYVDTALSEEEAGIDL